MKKILLQRIKTLPIEQQIFGPLEKMAALDIVGTGAEEQINNYPYHQIIYINKEKPIPIISISRFVAFNKSLIKQQPTFKQCLLKLPEINFGFLLFLTTAFQVIDSLRICDIIQSKKKRLAIPLLEQWLVNSFGYLIYAHQLEELYGMLTGCNYMEAITFRKDWNLKRPKSREIATLLPISPGIFLSDLLQQNTIEENQFAYNANFSGAFQLWQYMNQPNVNYEHATT